MKTVNLRPWQVWLLAGMIIAVMITGLSLQVLTGSPFLGAPFLVHYSEVFALSGFAIVGSLILWRHPRHPIGWLWLLISFAFGVDHFAWGYAYYGYIAHPGSLPVVEAAIIWLYWLGRATFGIVGLTLLLLLYPTGRPLSPRWGWLAWVVIGTVAVAIPAAAFIGTPVADNPFGPFPFPTDLLVASEAEQEALAWLRNITSLIGLICLLAAAASLFFRLFRTRGVERQQIKWFVYAVLFLPPAFILIFLAGRLPAINATWLILLGPILGVTASMGMASASALAIFRYRLWDIDVIIRRTLIYGALTLTLGLVYFSQVALIQQAFGSLTGMQNSPVAVVLSTLAISALFNPLHKRVQEFIDRHFYRKKYDAEKILAAFARSARDEPDIEALTTDILRAVQETVQPENLSLWLVNEQKIRYDPDH